jgi:uncharacterized protein YndB with AHSA1/START domain
VEEADLAPSIKQEILIDAPVDVVWRAVTEPGQVSRWFSDEVDLEATPGYRGALTFSNRDARQSMSVQVTVQSVQPERSFSYRWLHPQGATAGQGNSVLVEIALQPEGDGRLRVVETGLEHMGWPAEEQDSYIRDHTAGWVTYLSRLQDYLGRQHADQLP